MNQRQFKRSSAKGIRNKIVEFNISKKIAEYVTYAKNGEQYMEKFGSFVFFSSTSGEAWLLRVGDELALRLVDHYEPLPITVTETTEQICIEWTDKYVIDETAFVATREGRVSQFYNYPIEEIKLLTR